MESKWIALWVCMIVLIVSFLAQIAGIASDGWLVIDDPQVPYSFNYGLYYVNFCDGGNCDVYYIKDVPIYTSGVRLDKFFSVYRAGTGLAAALTLLGILFLSRLTTQCCANCQTCAGYNNHLTCLHSFILAAGLLATMSSAHMGTDISTRSDDDDVYSTPYSLILTGIGGILALVVFFILAIMNCRENDIEEFALKRGSPGQKYISPEEYFDKTEAYVNKHSVTTPAPVTTHAPVPTQPPQVLQVPDTTPPSYASSRVSYQGFEIERPQRRVEYVDPGPMQTRTYEHGTRVFRTEPNVYHITLK